MTNLEFILIIAVAYLWIIGGCYMTSVSVEDGTISKNIERIAVLLTWPFFMSFAAIWFTYGKIFKGK